jgi:hypothetical protein
LWHIVDAFLGTMWLINTTTLKLEYFHQAHEIEYAILSHTWGDEEITFQEIQSPSESVHSKKGFTKVKDCCRQANSDGLKYAWVDTCS